MGWEFLYPNKAMQWAKVAAETTNNKGSTVIDFGCASGKKAEEWVRCGYTVIGVDKYPQHAKIDARNRALAAENRAHSTITLLTADIRTLEPTTLLNACNGNKANIITAFDIIHFLENANELSAFFTLAHQAALAPDATFALSHLASPDGTEKLKTMTRHAPEQVTEQLQDAGFTVLRSEVRFKNEREDYAWYLCGL